MLSIDHQQRTAATQQHEGNEMNNSKQIINNLSWKQSITICGLMHASLAATDGEFGLLFESANYQFALEKKEYLKVFQTLSSFFVSSIMVVDDEIQYTLSNWVWNNREAIEYKGYNIGE